MSVTTRQFIMGVAVGLSVAIIFVSFRSLTNVPVQLVPTANHYQEEKRDFHKELDSIIANLSLTRFNQLKQQELKLKEDTHFHHDDDKEAKKLTENVRVLIWVMTSPQNLEKKATVVRNTWAKRANKVLFFSSVTDPKFPTVGLNTSEGREHLTAKTMQGFRYVYEHHRDDADWFMKADDDTYVILENLRYFLSDQNTSEPIFFGHHFKTIVKQGYYSGGGGYVLSKEALTRLATKGKDSSICRQDGGAEDAEIGHCMERLGVKTANTTDALGRSRFHCFDPETHLFGGYPDWYLQYDANGAKKGQESISDYAISFHYVPPEKMIALEFYIYHLRPYGILSGNQKLNAHNPNRLLAKT